MNKRAVLILVCILVFSALLGGCSERLESNRRISREAKRNAEKLAVEYVAEKYGIEAEPLGYSVQGNDVFMAYEASSQVIVPMAYGDEQFCVSLNLNNENSCLDNRQGQEVADALEVYLMGKFGLPEPVYSRLKFWTWGTEYNSAGMVTVDGISYDIDRMLNFYYDGQVGEELLNHMKIIEFYGNFVQPGFSLQDAQMFDPAVWPAQDDGMHISADLFLLTGNPATDEDLTRHRTYDQRSDWNGLLEYLRIDFSHATKPFTAGVWVPTEERMFRTYRTAELSGIPFVGMSPFDPGSCIKVSDEKMVWRTEKTFYNDGKGHTKTEVCEYEQISPLFYAVYPDDIWNEAVAQGISDDSSFAGIIPQAYIDQYGGEFYTGSYWPDTRQTEVRPIDGNTFAIMDKGIAPDRSEKMLMQRAVLHLTSREIVETGSPT